MRALVYREASTLSSRLREKPALVARRKYESGIRAEVSLEQIEHRIAHRKNRRLSALSSRASAMKCY